MEGLIYRSICRGREECDVWAAIGGIVKVLKDKVNNRQQIVKSFAHLLMYSSSGTRGVSIVILSGEQQIRQEITVSSR
jgi:hypothetical protein